MNKIFLLVDDDKDDRDLFVEAISSITPEVICYVAPDGKQALDLLEYHSNALPHIIFLDINMPVMNGWFCLKKIKSDERFKNIPVIIFSTASHQREIDIALDLGALCFCVKPDKFSLLKHLQEVVYNNLEGDLINALKQNNLGLFHFKKAE